MESVSVATAVMRVMRVVMENTKHVRLITFYAGMEGVFLRLPFAMERIIVVIRRMSRLLVPALRI